MISQSRKGIPGRASAFIGVLACLFALAFSAAASPVTFTMTNEFGAPNTNYIRLQKLQAEIQADGSFVTAGVPFRIYPNASGFVQTNLPSGSWWASNQFIVSQFGMPGGGGSSAGFFFIVDNSGETNPFTYYPQSGPNVLNWRSGIRGIIGTNGFTTHTNNGVITLDGALFTPTSNQVFTSFGFFPLSALEVTNRIAGAVPTNYWSSSALLWLSNLVFNAHAYGLVDTNDLRLATNALQVVIDTKQATLGYVPATNSNAGIVAAQGFASQPTNVNLTGFSLLQTNQLASTNVATATVTGLLRPSDWTNFNAKQNILAVGTNMVAYTNANGVLIINATGSGSGSGQSVAPGTLMTATTNGTLTTVSAVGQTNGLQATAFTPLTAFQPSDSDLTNWATIGTNQFSRTNVASASVTGPLSSNDFLSFSTITNALKAGAYSIVPNPQPADADLTNWANYPTNVYLPSQAGRGTNTTFNHVTNIGRVWFNTGDFIDPSGDVSLGNANVGIDGAGTLTAPTMTTVDGQGLENLDASNLALGTVAVARLPYVPQPTNTVLTGWTAHPTNLYAIFEQLLKIDTNTVVLTNAGTAVVMQGGYKWNGGIYSNEFNSAHYIVYEPPSWIVKSNTTSLYSASAVNGSYVAVNGAAPAPIGIFGLTINAAAVVFQNWVNSTNLGARMSALTNGLGNAAFMTANSLTNGFVTAGVTNGLATTNYVTGQGYVTSTVTNGLASVNFTTNLNTISSNALQAQISGFVAGSGFQTNNGTGTNNIFTGMTLGGDMSANSKNILGVNLMSFSGDVYITNADQLHANVVIGGTQNSFGNSSFHFGSVVIGGTLNVITNDTSSISYAAILGGSQNVISNSSDNAAIVGGFRNSFGDQSDYSLISGGTNNAIRAASAAIVGGANNRILGVGSASNPDNAYNGIFSGRGNILSNAQYSFIGGGLSNVVMASNAFVLGVRGRVLPSHDGSVVISDNRGTFFDTATNQQVIIRMANGVSIGTNDPSSNAMLKVAGPVSATAFIGPLSSGITNQWRLDATNAARSVLSDFFNGRYNTNQFFLSHDSFTNSWPDYSSAYEGQWDWSDAAGGWIPFVNDPTLEQLITNWGNGIYWITNLTSGGAPYYSLATEFPFTWRTNSDPTEIETALGSAPTNSVYAAAEVLELVKTSQLARVSLSPSVPTTGVDIVPQLGFEQDVSFTSSERAVTNTIKIAKENGMSQFYRIILLNNWTASTRDANGNLQADSQFPSGMAYVANYIHTNGFKLGLQIQMSGSAELQYHMHQDATNMIGTWGADAVLIDFNSGSYRKTDETYRNLVEQFIVELRDASKIYRRPIHISISGAPEEFEPWVAAAGNSWTFGPDGNADPGNLTNHVGILSEAVSYSGPGHHYNMNSLSLFSGNTNLFLGALAMRAIGPSRIVVHDTNFTAFSLISLTNASLLAIHQDKDGRAGRIVSTNGLAQTWYRQLSSGEHAVALWNPTTTATAVTLNLNDIGLRTNDVVNVHTVFWETNFTATSGFTVTVPTNTALLYTIRQAILTNDIALNTPFTNGPIGLDIAESFVLTSATDGSATVAAYIDTENDGTFEQTGIKVSLGTNVVTFGTFQLSFYVPPFASATLTNLSTSTATATVSGGSTQKRPRK